MATTSSDEEILIDPNDFDSVSIDVGVENTTTHTKVSKKDVVTFLEILDDGLKIEVPKRVCSSGHSLLLDLKVHLPQQDNIIMAVTAKVVEVISLDETDAVIVRHVQYDEASWAKILDWFSNRQQQINNFFQAAKG